MFDDRSLIPKPERPPARPLHQQRITMVMALSLLVIALGVLLYRDRDFWFPDTPETLAGQAPGVQVQQSSPMLVAEASSKPAPATHGTTSRTKAPVTRPTSVAPATVPPTTSAEDASSENGAVVTRTALPPLEVEVVAGDTHRLIHPGTNSVRVDLQPGTPAQPIAVPPSAATSQASPQWSYAAERVAMSADASQAVTHSVKPDYPLLARQMKVQGSVVLQALISREGDIQDLHVVSGPPILAGAAQEAVRQWRFKPHYLGAESVETQAKITVNFTISTN